MPLGSRGLAVTLLSVSAALALVLVGVDIALAPTNYLARRPVHVAAVMIVPSLAVFICATWVRRSLLDRLNEIETNQDRLARRVEAVINGQVETGLQLERVTDDIPAIPVDVVTMLRTLFHATLEERARVVGRARVTVRPIAIDNDPTVPLTELPPRRRARRRPRRRTGIDPSTIKLMKQLEDELGQARGNSAGNTDDD